MSKKKEPKPRRPTPELNPLQVNFVEEYMIDGKQQQAAIRAGYSPKTAHAQASRLLKKVKIQELIRIRQTELTERYNVTIDKIVKEYARLAFFDPKLCYDAQGNLLPVPAMPEDARRVLAGFDLEVTKDGKEVIHVRKVRMADKIRALDSLSRINGLFQDKLIHDVTQGYAEILKEVRERDEKYRSTTRPAKRKR
ncbi:MAG: terminase small subunit [Acidiferrobacterales bacterium]